MFRKRFSALGTLIFCVPNCPMLIRLAPGFEDAVIEDFSWTYFLWPTISDSHPAPKLKYPLSVISTTVCTAVGVSPRRCVSACPAHVLHGPWNPGLYQLWRFHGPMGKTTKTMLRGPSRAGFCSSLYWMFSVYCKRVKTRSRKIMSCLTRKCIWCHPLIHLQWDKEAIKKAVKSEVWKKVSLSFDIRVEKSKCRWAYRLYQFWHAA